MPKPVPAPFYCVLATLALALVNCQRPSWPPPYRTAPPAYQGGPPAYQGGPPAYQGGPPTYQGGPPAYEGAAPPAYGGEPISHPAWGYPIRSLDPPAPNGARPLPNAPVAPDSAWHAVSPPFPASPPPGRQHAPPRPANPPAVAPSPPPGSLSPPQYVPTGEVHQGKASWYGVGANLNAFTASGEPFRSSDQTAAHRTLPFGTRVRVTNLQNEKSAIVRINDRGSFRPGRIIDVTLGVARKLDMVSAGVVPCEVEVLRKRSDR